MKIMVTSRAPKQVVPTRVAMLTYGLIFGPGVGLLIALIFAGGDAIASGIAYGAGLGVAAGALMDAEHDRRTK